MTGAPPARDALDRAPDEIAARASDVGQVRLDRTNLDILLTGVIGGTEVSLGGLAAMLVVGAALTAWPGLPPTSPTASSSIIGASLLLVGYAAAGKTLLDVLQWVLIATAGNLVGGVGLVTLFRVVQAREAVRGNGRQT